MAAPQQQRPAGGGNILMQRLGPLATWVWLLIGTVLVTVISLYLRHKQGGSSAAPKAQAGPGEVTGAQNVPDIILQNYQQNTQTVTEGTEPPETPPPTSGHPIPTPNPHPKPIPAPKPPPKPQKYRTVTVARWPGKGKNGLAQWNSTLWGIANHYHVKGGYRELAKLNGIKNPNLIYPGQKIKVPV